MGLAVVRDLREAGARRGPTDEIPTFETDVLAGFALARSAAGLADATIRSDVIHLGQIRTWFGQAAVETRQPADADAYFGRVLRDAQPGHPSSRVPRR